VTPLAWMLLSSGLVAAGVWLACSEDVFGGAWFTHVCSSGLLLVVGLLGLLLAVSTIRTRVRVFPDRLEATVALGRTRTIHPGELARFRASGTGNDVVSAWTARGRTGFQTNRFHRHHNALEDWLDRNGGEPWAEHRAFSEKLTRRTKRKPVADTVSMLVIVAFFVTIIAICPGLFVLVAYDDAHQEQVTCTITAAEAITVSNRSAKGIGSSHPAVGIDSSDCGRLTFSRGIDDENQERTARAYDRAPGPYTFTVGAGSFWVRQHAPWARLGPTVYAISTPR